MSIGVAIGKIAQYTSRMEQVEGQIAAAEADFQLLGLAALGSGHPVDPLKAEQIKVRIAVLKFLVGFYKDAVQFWQDVIKETLQFLKSLNDLAKGASG